MDGVRLGPYRLLAELGSGGMGKVFRAEVTGTVPGLEPGSSVALKVIHAHLLETPGFFKRFLREADIGRGIEHENVVRTLDCDALVQDGIQQNFLVMEYVEGQTLRDLLQELERVPEELCRHIGREVAKGLAAIHEAGVVHRDLKPENVLITADHVVKVMDLGVARLQAEAIRLSQTGAFVGSLEYAAPEQFRSADGEPDGRADLHALGILLYELSTGVHPFRDEDAGRIIGRILNDVPRKAGDVNPQLSPFFEEIVHKLLAKARDERFPDASGVADALAEGEGGDWWKRRATAIRRQTQRPLRRIRIPRETALYGRDGDLAALHALYEKAKAEDGQVLLIEGEAGIGKTRLVDEFVGRLRAQGEDVNFLFGSYPPGGAATASVAFSTAYREHFGEVGLAETLKGYLTVTPLLVPAFAALLKGDATPSDAQPLTKDSLQTVFVHATRSLAAGRTTIVLIDDLHFAPQDGRALFSSLAMGVPGHRMLVIGTMRPGVPPEWTAGVTRLGHAEQRSLQRLGPKDLTRLLQDAFRSERLAEELAFRIAQKSDGNPFFAFEIIRGLREGRFISQQPDGTWVGTKVIRDIRVPSSVLDLVNARVADLEEPERDLLDVASCCGFAFDPTLVAEAAGVSLIPALKRFGQIERRHRLVRASGPDCKFDHHQVQEAIYESLLPRLKEAYHAAIAGAMEARATAGGHAPQDGDCALCVDVCTHFLKGAQGERALPYLEAAFAHLERGFLNDQAIALADRVLEVPGLLEGKERVQVLLRKNERLEMLGRRDAQEAVLSEARTCAAAAGETAWLAKVERRTRGLLWFLGRYEEAREHCERDLRLTRESDDRRGEALATMNLAGIAMNEGHLEEARKGLERSISLAQEAGDWKIEADATGSLGHVLYSLARYEEARVHHERQRSLACANGDRQGEGWAAGNLGILFVSLGEHEKGRRQHERHLAIAREMGDRRGEGIAHGNLGVLFSSRGHFADAEEHYRHYLAITREVGARELEANALLGLGSLWRLLGQTERARLALEASLALCRKIGAGRWEAYALADLSSVADEEGDAALALALVKESMALHRKSGDEFGVANTLIQVGEIHVRVGDVGAALEVLGEAATLLQGQQRQGELAFVQALLACLPEGDGAAAVAGLAEAGESGDTAGVRHQLWKATHDVEHLLAAKRHLDALVERAPEAYRASMVDGVRLHREITEAWASLGLERGSP